MRRSPLETIYDRWTHPSWEVRVRATKLYLWGSAQIVQAATFTTQPPILHLRNEEFGSPVELFTEAGGTQTTVGTLGPGQCFSLELQGLSGVGATCDAESVVACVIHD